MAKVVSGQSPIDAFERLPKSERFDLFRRIIAWHEGRAPKPAIDAARAKEAAP